MTITDSNGNPCNICNLPQVATIELYTNGREYFSESITYHGHASDGFWIGGLLTEKERETIINIAMKSRRRLARKLREEREHEQN